MGKISSFLERKILASGQGHLLKFLKELNDSETERYQKQLQSINWTEMRSLIREYVLSKSKHQVPAGIIPAPYYPYPTEDKVLLAKYRGFRKLGRRMIMDGKVALLTVAGGQGTRLGFDGPKGTYPITPVKSKSFFQYFAEKIKGACRKYRVDLKWLIMTSPVNKTATEDFFKKNNFFGMKASSVKFFVQGTMPAISMDGKLIMESKSSLALSPNGHGGTIRALKDSGLLDFLEKRGIEMLSYFQVDNLIVPPLDELFIGIHSSTKSDVSSRMLAKTGPHEKLGNFCVSRKRLHIIEYSDMPEELALQRDDEGRLRFISGSPAIHVFSLKFLKRLCNPRSSIKLPWHRADKKVPFIDGNGKFIRPDTSNAVKLETFIFDSLPLAKRTIILEGIRNEQFSPTKNPDGVDSVQSARAMLSERDASWLEAAGIPVPKTKDGKPDCILELSPMEYYDLEDVIQKKSQIAAPKKGEKKYYG